MLNRLTATGAVSAVSQPPQEEHGLDLREAIGFLWRQWIFIASIVATILFVAAVYVFTQTPHYTASALVLLETQQERAGRQQDAILSEVNLDSEMVESQLAIIKSTVFLRRVVEKLGLISDSEFGSPGSATPQSLSLFARIRSVFSSESSASTPARQNQDEITTARTMSSVQTLRGEITAARAGQGYVIGISVTSTDPARAARLANAVADGYVVEKLDARFEAAKRASAWLSDRLGDMRSQLRQSEEAVAQFRADHKLLQAGNNISLNQQQLSELNAKLVDARTDVAQKKARADIFHSIEEKDGDLQSVPDAPTSSQLTALRNQEATLMQTINQFAPKYSDTHPMLINARLQLRDVQRGIAAEMRKLEANVDNDYLLAKAKADALEQAFRASTGQIDIDDKTAITLRELERTAAVNKSLFEDFLQRAKITQEQSTFEARDSRVITPATPPGVPSSPKKGQFMGLALIMGLFLGIGGAVAKDKLNGGFATPRQIEDMLQLPLLTSVNVMNSRDLTVKGKILPLPYYANAMPLSRYSESIRTLRSGIQMTDVDHPPKIIQVTSTVPHEGKTTVGLSLAVSAAFSGLKVLFIDADLRHTSGSNFFGLVRTKGLVDALLGDSAPKEFMHYNKEAKLWVLPAGTKTNNPADLLSSNRMKLLMEQFSETFDYIVIDSPPIGPVVDPIVLSHVVDSVVYVVRWASTARELIQHSIKRLPEDKVAGVVFNMLNEKAAQKYGKYAYEYYYGSRSYKKYYEG
jgi:succinoglycan biosynthesis transport protein ExoP